MTFLDILPPFFSPNPLIDLLILFLLALIAIVLPNLRSRR